MGRKDNKFLVGNAYKYLSSIPKVVETNIDWNIIWKWKIPHWIKTFTWLMDHERILANSRRHKWNPTIFGDCKWCTNNEVNLIHVLRDCWYETHVCIGLAPYDSVLLFALQGFYLLQPKRKCFRFTQRPLEISIYGLMFVLMEVGEQSIVWRRLSTTWQPN